VSVSAVQAVSRAIDTTKALLFPFDLHRWLTVGFVAWLAYLGEAGYSLQIPTLPGTRGGSTTSGHNLGFDEMTRFVREYLALVIGIGVVVTLLFFAFTIALIWVSSRGKLMLLDVVVTGRAHVKQPWQRYAELAKSLFWFRMVLGFVMLLLLGGIGVLVLSLLWPLLASHSDVFTRAFFMPILLGIGVAGVTLGPLAIVGALLDDFVVPVMFLHHCRISQAWRIARSQIFSGHAAEIIVFYLLKFVAGLAIGLIAMLAMCFTCCLAALPYVGTVVLLPTFVFLRCYSLCFIEQLGPAWRVFPVSEWTPWVQGGGYFVPPGR
jgi:hypothetical protein